MIGVHYDLQYNVIYFATDALFYFLLSPIADKMTEETVGAIYVMVLKAVNKIW